MKLLIHYWFNRSITSMIGQTQRLIWWYVLRCHAQEIVGKVSFTRTQYHGLVMIFNNPPSCWDLSASVSAHTPSKSTGAAHLIAGTPLTALHKQTGARVSIVVLASHCQRVAGVAITTIVPSSTSTPWNQYIKKKKALCTSHKRNNSTCIWNFSFSFLVFFSFQYFSTQIKIWEITFIKSFKIVGWKIWACDMSSEYQVIIF